MSAKPTLTAIRAAVRLTRLRPEYRTPDPMAQCHLCGASAQGDRLRLWRECDERDEPIPGTDGLLFVCHRAECAAIIEKHPRLYVEDRTGDPGHFPALCGPCTHRDGLECRHPDLRTNGGPGLAVRLYRLRAIVCSRFGEGGCHVPQQEARECAGFIPRK